MGALHLANRVAGTGVIIDLPVGASAGTFLLQGAGVDTCACIVVKVLEVTVASEVTAHILAGAVLIVWNSWPFAFDFTIGQASTGVWVLEVVIRAGALAFTGA